MFWVFTITPIFRCLTRNAVVFNSIRWLFFFHFKPPTTDRSIVLMTQLTNTFLCDHGNERKFRLPWREQQGERGGETSCSWYRKWGGWCQWRAWEQSTEQSHWRPLSPHTLTMWIKKVWLPRHVVVCLQVLSGDWGWRNKTSSHPSLCVYTQSKQQTSHWG